jgi:predicted GNAT superfamily acetyltransferase
MVTHAPPIVIREIKELPELRVVEELQKQIWGCSEREILPSLALIPIIEVGGILLGAFDQNDLIGFVLGFPGIEDGRLILHSDMLAVKPEYRSHGLGYRLKLAQRDKALEKGVETITWTFDPLQSLNAHLNFARLGVISNRYLVNYYGQTSSFLHSTGTDRLWVTWLLNSDRVEKKLEGSAATDLSKDIEGAATVLAVGNNCEPVLKNNTGEDSVAIEIPGNINELMIGQSGLAVQWREASRQAFTNVLDKGYTVTEFYRSERDGKSVGSYLTQRS